MIFSSRYIFGVCVISFFYISSVYNYPRSNKYKPPNYDQKQTGDYNVQLHLKDFHIVAVLGDDSWGSYADYDYNYDYSDLTIKPIIPITTPHPQNESNSSVNPNVVTHTPEIGEHKSTTTPIPSTTANSEKSTTTKTQQTTSNKPSYTTNKPIEITIPVKIENPSTVKIEKPSTIKIEKPSTVKIETPSKATKKIDEGQDNKTESSVTNISIVPPANADSNANATRLPLGEIMHYRKCAEGFVKDNQGRCRKLVRRAPNLPFGITRFASKLASKLRNAAIGNNSS